MRFEGDLGGFGADRDFEDSSAVDVGRHATQQNAADKANKNGATRIQPRLYTRDLCGICAGKPSVTIRGMLRLVIALAALAIPIVSAPRTVVTIRGDQFFINGQPTYSGRTWNGHKIEGLLLNSRMVQGIYDDANPETVKRWAYKDTGKWDAERNTREFIAAMPEWRKHGLNSLHDQPPGRQP